MHWRSPQPGDGRAVSRNTRPLRPRPRPPRQKGPAAQERRKLPASTPRTSLAASVSRCAHYSQPVLERAQTAMRQVPSPQPSHRLPSLVPCSELYSVSSGGATQSLLQHSHRRHCPARCGEGVSACNLHSHEPPVVPIKFHTNGWEFDCAGL